MSIPNAATYAVHYSDGGERLSAGYDFDSRYWSGQAFIRCYESDDATIRVDFGDVRWLGLRLLDIASAIEARSDATTQIGAAEGESATRRETPVSSRPSSVATDEGVVGRKHVMPGDPDHLQQTALQWWLRFEFGGPNYTNRESNIAVESFKDGYRAAIQEGVGEHE